MLMPGTEDIKTEDLQFREYAHYVNGALKRCGLIETTNFEDAEIVIFLGYGIGDPETEHYSYSSPILGKTGGGSASYHGTTYGSGGVSTTSGTIHSTPTYGVVGTLTHSSSKTKYFRFLVLSAVDVASYKGEKKLVPVWETTVTSRGRSGDLRRVFPVLVAAAEPHIGTNTGKQITVNLSERNKRVKVVKGEISK
jgi:hypothetical protein